MTSKREIRNLAASLMPVKAVNLLPQIPRDFIFVSGSSTAGATPAVLRHQSLFRSTMSDLMRHRLSYGMSSKEFGASLCSGLNSFTSKVHLPQLSSCSLFNGYSSVELGMYTGARYVTRSGSIDIHFEIDSKKFVSRVAHELTHLEQDFLFVCLLADHLAIGQRASLSELESLQKLCFQNSASEPEINKLSRFLEERKGEKLIGPKKTRAIQLLSDFRYGAYLRAVQTNQRQCLLLPDSISFLQWIRLDYEVFFDSVKFNLNQLPHSIRDEVQNLILEVIAKPEQKKSIGRRLFFLLKYYRQNLQELADELLYLLRFALYFEREAYGVGNSFHQP